MNIRDLPLVERLAIEQALFKSIADDVSTKNPESLRSYVDGEIVSNYRATGAKSYDVHVNGEKVGTYSVRVSKGKPASEKKFLAVDNPIALESFVQSDECADERMEYVTLMAKNFAEFLLNTYGIVADGCEVVTESIPEQPSTVSGTTLRIDEHKVFAAMGNSLPTAIAGLLQGGEDA